MSEEKGLVVKRFLPVTVDSYRKNALADQMATSQLEAKKIEDHMKRVQESLKEEIKRHVRQVNICATAISQGVEMVEVACREEVDITKNAIRVYRMDTGEMIEERAMDGEERKVHLRSRR